LTPYLVPDSYTLKRLRLAAERGVDVRLLVPRKSDMRIARWAARYLYGSLLSSAARIYEYLPRVLHVRTVVINGSWSMVGTANLDYRSLFTNYELSLATPNAELACELNEQFFTICGLRSLLSLKLGKNAIGCPADANILQLFSSVGYNDVESSLYSSGVDGFYSE